MTKTTQCAATAAIAPVVSRRRLMVALGLAPPLLAAPAVVRAATISGERCGLDRIWMARAGLNEELSIKLTFDTTTQAQAALGKISWFFRDWKDRNTAMWIDPNLPHVLAGIQTLASRKYGSDRIITLTSGYRTPERNATLEGAAPNSLHIHGQAADIVIGGFTPAEVKDLALQSGVGGVGVYTRHHQFTHVDTGRRRFWYG